MKEKDSSFADASSEYAVTVGEPDAGLRVDAFLARRFPEFSRSRMQDFFRAGEVFCNGKVIEKKYRIRSGDLLRFVPPVPVASEWQPVSMELSILFEDEDFLALNKPAGLVVHPGSGTGSEATLVHGLLAHCAGELSGIGGVERPGIVHRLDRETSGVMVVAKNDQAHRALAQSFAERSLVKEYQALVVGVPRLLSGICRGPIGRHPVQRHKMAVVEPGEGREARTDWKVLETFGTLASRLGFRLHTGRTHQIRVHSKELGHPLLGDRTYGFHPGQFAGPPVPRVMLHSRFLSLSHPRTGKSLALEAPFPADWDEVRSQLPEGVSR